MLLRDNRLTTTNNIIFIPYIIIVAVKGTTQLSNKVDSVNGNNAAEGIQRYNLETSIV